MANQLSEVGNGGYYYERHGLLYIVYRVINKSMGDVLEDSRWESEQKAKHHCYILNLTPEELENSCKMFASIDGSYSKNPDPICLNCNQHIDMHL